MEKISLIYYSHQRNYSGAIENDVSQTPKRQSQLLITKMICVLVYQKLFENKAKKLILSISERRRGKHVISTHL